jgi:hypothetical protein
MPDATVVALLSPSLLLREVEALLETSRDRATLRNGWARLRHLFPSVFWSLAWYGAPAGMLPRLIRQLELAPAGGGTGDAPGLGAPGLGAPGLGAPGLGAPAPGAPAPGTLVLLHSEADEGPAEPISPLGRRRISQVLLGADARQLPTGPDGEARTEQSSASHESVEESSVASCLELDFCGWVSRGAFVVRQEPQLTRGASDSPGA